MYSRFDLPHWRAKTVSYQAETPLLTNKKKGSMKALKVLAVIGLAIASVIPSFAQQPQKAWSGSGTVLSNALDQVTYYVAPALSVNPGPACLGFVNCRSDAGTAVLQFYNATNIFALDATNVTVSGAGGATNVPLLGVTNGAIVISNGVCVIRHKATETYERNRFFAGTSTNIIFMYPLVTTTAAGDVVYAEAPSGSIQIGTNNPVTTATSIGPIGGGAGIASGNLIQGANTPFLMEIGGTVISTSVKINVANGFYLP